MGITVVPKHGVSLHTNTQVIFNNMDECSLKNTLITSLEVCVSCVSSLRWQSHPWPLQGSRSSMTMGTTEEWAWFQWTTSQVSRPLKTLLAVVLFSIVTSLLPMFRSALVATSKLTNPNPNPNPTSQEPPSQNYYGLVFFCTFSSQAPYHMKAWCLPLWLYNVIDAQTCGKSGSETFQSNQIQQWSFCRAETLHTRQAAAIQKQPHRPVAAVTNPIFNLINHRHYNS